MSEKSSVGVSKRVFVGGLVTTLILSVILSYGILVGVGSLKGEKEPPGGVEPDVTASLTSTYTNVWLGTDYHDVKGLIINFGSDPAYNVAITITWHITGGGEHTEPAHLIGNFGEHQIYKYSKRYYFEGDYDYITWEITWS